MKLTQLLGALENHELHGNGAQEISSVTCDSRKVVPGALFFALRGTVADGHRFIGAAVAAGAAAVVLEDAGCAPVGLPWVRVADGRSAMGLMAAAYGFVVVAPTNEVFYYVGMLLCGIGWSSLISIVFAIYSEAVDSREMGVSMGVFNSSLVLPALAVPGLLKLSDALDQHRWVFALFAICLALSFAFWCAVNERE